MQNGRMVGMLATCLVMVCAGCQPGGHETVADLESGRDPTNLGGTVGAWSHGASAEASYVAGGAGGSAYAAQVAITGNDHPGADGWSGGGLVLTLRDAGAVMDVTPFSHIAFSVRMSEGSQLAATTVKLEDNRGVQRPERRIAEYGGPIGTDWKRVRIPLADFVQLRPSDRTWWVATDLKRVVRFVTVSLHDDTTKNGNGILQIDDVVLE